MNRFDLQPKREATLPPLNDAQQQYARGHLVLARRLAWKQFQSCAHTMPLDDINRAFDLMRSGESIRSVILY